MAQKPLLPVRHKAHPSSIMIASSSGHLVQTEKMMSEYVHNWRTNLLSWNRKAPPKPEQDPRLTRRGKSESELSVLQVPAAKVKTFDRHTGMPISDYNHYELLQQRPRHLQREQQEQGEGEREEGILIVRSSIDEMETFDEMVFGGGSGNNKKSTMSNNNNNAASQMQPQHRSFNLITPPSTILAPTTQFVKGIPPPPLSPSQAAQRRYKIGLSPKQKVRNLLDDLVDKQQRLHEPRPPLGAGADGNRDEDDRVLSAITDRIASRQGEGGGEDEEEKEGESKMIGLDMDEDVDVKAAVEEGVVDIHENYNEEEEQQQQQQQQHHMLISSQQVMVLGSNLDFENSTTISATQCSEGIPMSDSINFDLDTDGNNDQTDDEIGTVLSGQDVFIQRSLLLDPIDPMLGGGGGRRDRGGSSGNKNMSSRGTDKAVNGSRPVSRLTDMAVTPSSGREGGNNNRLQPRFHLTKNNRDNIKSTQQQYQQQQQQQQGGVFIPCSKCGKRSTLWCAGCVLGFCYTCWGLVRHHEKRDSTVVLYNETLGAYEAEQQRAKQEQEQRKYYKYTRKMEEEKESYIIEQQQEILFTTATNEEAATAAAAAAAAKEEAVAANTSSNSYDILTGDGEKRDGDEGGDEANAVVSGEDDEKQGRGRRGGGEGRQIHENSLYVDGDQESEWKGEGVEDQQYMYADSAWHEPSAESEGSEYLERQEDGRVGAIVAMSSLPAEQHYYRLLMKGEKKEDVRLAPSLLEFDEKNHTHFAAERKFPERVLMLTEMQAKRLKETSARTKGMLAINKAIEHRVSNITTRIDEQVRKRLESKQKRKNIAQSHNDQRVHRATPYWAAPGETITAIQATAVVVPEVDPEVVFTDPRLKGTRYRRPVNSPQAGARHRSRSPPGINGAAVLASLKLEMKGIVEPDASYSFSSFEGEDVPSDDVREWGWSPLPAKSAQHGNFPHLPGTVALPIKLLWEETNAKNLHAEKQALSPVRRVPLRSFDAQNEVEIQKVASLW